MNDETIQPDEVSANQPTYEQPPARMSIEDRVVALAGIVRRVVAHLDGAEVRDEVHAVLDAVEGKQPAAESGQE